ncbi:hypothetical protein PHLCEN_2v2466 [Hermanssonia centrifuga]|uniref:Uncharacterized protein n=1 Tax=Hermanssonia centrifuga TaxID=98765 RepID=A0A2R6RLU0_9APHY|nr:hypothetical protein PHLCEN_2v2466 [Hermanssonia centrifuga]
MNIAQMVSNTVNASTFIDNSSLTPILFSRFLLNLRQLGEPASENETHSRFNSRFSIPGFRVPTLESVVGNMGAELDHGPTEEVDDHDEGGEADLDGGDVEVAVFDVITEDGSDGLVTESVYEIQEVGLLSCY